MQTENSPGDVGGEREAKVHRHPKIEVLGAREAGDVEAERGLAAWSQETWRATELQGRARQSCWPHLPALPTHTAHLQQHRGYTVRLRGRPPQALARSVLANQHQREGHRDSQQRGRQGGSKEASVLGSHRLQGYPAQMCALRHPSKDNMGKMRPAIHEVLSRDQPRHFDQQLRLQT